MKICRFFNFILPTGNKLRLLIAIIAIGLVTNLGFSYAANSPTHKNVIKNVALAKASYSSRHNDKNTVTSPTSLNVSTLASISPASTTSIVTAAPSCSTDSTYIPAVAIKPQHPGLTITLESPSTYTIYGNNISQIESEMISCTPVTSSGTGGFAGKFAASTANDMSWQASFNSDGNGMCSLTNVSVLVHINQVFPKWQATADATSGLNAHWLSFINQLVIYEQGHVQLDKQGGVTLLNDLENFPATSCITINQALNAKAQSDMNITLAENTAYDNNNDFGPKF